MDFSALETRSATNYDSGREGYSQMLVPGH